MGKTGPYSFIDRGLSAAFVPNNRHEAKKNIQRDDFGMHLDNFDLKHNSEQSEYKLSKRKRLAGEFKHSYTNESLRQSILRKSIMTVDPLATHGSTMTANSIQTSTNYNTFLTDKDELPRLSILSNYDHIMRIMTKNFISSKNNTGAYKINDGDDQQRTSLKDT
jgi:hypothetical protein